MSYNKGKGCTSAEWRISPCIWLLPPLAASMSILWRCVEGILAEEGAELYRHSGEVICCLLFLLIYDSLIAFRLFSPYQSGEAKQGEGARKLLHASRKWHLMAAGVAVLAALPRVAKTFGMSAYPEMISEMALAVCTVATVLGVVPLIRLFLLAAWMKDTKLHEEGE